MSKRILPKVGVVKYKVADWKMFPETVEVAKELAKKWSYAMSSSQQFNGYIVNIYFHLLHKTVRFEVREDMPVMFNY